MKKEFETLIVDLEDDCVFTDEEVLYNVRAIHKLMKRISEAATIGFVYITCEEDSDIKGIIHLKLREESRYAKKRDVN